MVAATTLTHGNMAAMFWMWLIRELHRCGWRDSPGMGRWPKLVHHRNASQARTDWHQIFKVMKSKDLQSRLLYPARLSFRMEGQIKRFPNKKKTEVVLYHKKC